MHRKRTLMHKVLLMCATHRSFNNYSCCKQTHTHASVSTELVNGMRHAHEASLRCVSTDTNFCTMTLLCLRNQFQPVRLLRPQVLQPMFCPQTLAMGLKTFTQTRCQRQTIKDLDRAETSHREASTWPQSQWFTPRELEMCVHQDITTGNVH